MPVSADFPVTRGIFLVALLAACSATTEPVDTPPVLPPQTSMVISFDDFVTANPALATAFNAAGANWTRSAVIVVGWHSVLGTALATPVAAFLAAAQQQPQQQEDGSWAWTYDFTVLGVSHTARLEARSVPAGVQWDMFITKQDEFSNFHWFFGTSDGSATSGQWNLNFNPTDPTPFMRIDWSRDPANGTGEIQYTNVVPTGQENGAFIMHGLTSESYDAFFDVYSASTDNLTTIQWNRASKSGRVMDELFYGDAIWHCWDGTLEDVTCS